MRLSLWQQFSSNHSGYFWVVGTFQTVEAAHAAYDEMREMLKQIDRWHQEHKAESKAALEAGKGAPLPPEQAFAEKYQVEWPSTIDWTNWAGYRHENHPSFASFDASAAAQRLIDDAVRTVGRCVIVHNPDQTWMTTQPFETILSHFGAQTFGYDLNSVEDGTAEIPDLHTRLTFRAPDTPTANQIETALTGYANGDLTAADNPPPWNNADEHFRQVAETSKVLKAEHLAALERDWQDRFNLHNSLAPSPYGLDMLQQKYALRNSDLKLKRRELRFTLDDLWFHNDELGVSALIAWLESNQCTEIDFRYVGKLDGED